MEAEEVYERVRALDLPKGKYAVFGSAPMCVRRLRACNDVDIVVTEDVWNSFKNKDDWKFGRKPDGSEYLEKNGVELWKNWAPGEWDINRLIREADVIDDVPFVKLNDVAKWKRINGRKKDLNDVKIIEEYLKTK